MDALRQEKATPPDSSQEDVALANALRWLRDLRDHALPIVDGDDHDDRDVHQVRLTTKRLRALWRMLDSADFSEQVDAESRRLAETARVLAAERDAFVLREMLQDLRRQTSRKKDRKAIDAVLEHLPRPRESSPSPIRAYAEFLRPRMHRGFDGLLEALHEVTHGEVLLEGAGRTYARARRLGRKAYRRNTPRSFHRWRKWVKYLRYQLEILDPHDDELKAMSEALDRLGKILGASHDMANLRDRLGSGALSVNDRSARERVAKLTRGRERDLIESSKPLAMRVFAEPRKRFVQQLAAACS